MIRLLGINGAELVVLLIVALIVLGPDGAKQALAGLHRVVGWGRSLSRRLREEARGDLQGLGVSPDQWQRFTLREYDPTEIVRQAVREEMDAWRKETPAGSSGEQHEGRGTL